MLTIIGPTASGKTNLAVAVANRLDAEIISGDSRQIYKGMDIGTGKDLGEYIVEGRKIQHHLIDIVPAGTKYTVYDYQRDFFRAYHDITSRGVQPILCGGSGLYVEAVIRGYNLPSVPINQQLRNSLEGKTLSELTDILASLKPLHNITDLDTPQRAIRAIEIEVGRNNNQQGIQETNLDISRKALKTENKTPENSNLKGFSPIVFGISIDRELRRQRITERLHKRLEEGMLAEVQTLLNSGIAPEDLIYYGLEYKFLTLHLIGQLSYEKMVHDLEIAIHQFAKRQMTWFRGMERRGITIHWIDGTLPMEDKVNQIIVSI